MERTVHLETPSQKYFLEMLQFKKWFFDLWENEDVHSNCNDENYDLTKNFSKLGFQIESRSDVSSIYCLYDSILNQPRHYLKRKFRLVLKKL